MAYEKMEWVNDETRLNATNMNGLEDRIGSEFNIVETDIEEIKEQGPLYWGHYTTE